jgi:hypothetical protein
MNSPAFQAAFVRLVTDQAFRDAVRDGNVPDGIDDPVERAHLSSLASQPGIAAMRVVYRSFRLNKILALLPLTGYVLGEERLSDELERYWQQTPSGSFYYFEEAGRFCEYLAQRVTSGELDIALLRDVLLYERTCLQLRHAVSEGRRLAVQVDFDHALSLFPDLAAREPRADITPCPTTAWGVAQESGVIEWYVDDRTPTRDASPRDNRQSSAFQDTSGTLATSRGT